MKRYGLRPGKPTQRVQSIACETTGISLTQCLAVAGLTAVALTAIATPAQAQLTGLVPFQDVSVQPEFVPDPMILRGTSGGELTAEAIAGSPETETGLCFGYVNLEPDHHLTLTDAFTYLNVEVNSPCDTMLVIQGPGGTWCNDDSLTTRNPRIAGQWLPGEYRIWVGSAFENQYFPYRLHLSEVE
ncbi:MAG: hypothetical protein AAGF24_08240 [Cyanobacteria bacterium P01_H01_bin.121]